MALDNSRSDFTLGASAPQVPDSGQLGWATSVSAGTGIPTQYRISGTTARERNRIQAGIFGAGAPIGIAGAALLGLAESLITNWIWRRAELKLRAGHARTLIASHFWSGLRAGWGGWSVAGSIRWGCCIRDAPPSLAPGRLTKTHYFAARRMVDRAALGVRARVGSASLGPSSSAEMYISALSATIMGA